MSQRVSKKRKSSDDETLDSEAKCRHCEKMVPSCRSFQCSRNRQHYACIDCLRIVAEDIVFEGADNYNHETKGINCFRNKCSGVFPYDEVRIHLIPEMAAALNAVMTKFNCSVCFLDHSMKDGITCQKVEQTAEDRESHTFCLECIKEFAARDETALAYGGRGLGCMEGGCQHALMLNQIKSHLPKDVVKRLEERVMDENIGHAEIEGLQRCQKCNLAYEVIGGRYFVCSCGNKQCITCGSTFDNKHTNINCQKKKSKSEQTLDDQINDVVVRLCHKCNLQFVKSSGCNFMRCRCGATQCYICREKNINNDHFCKCPGLQEECTCTKKCRQFADANHIDAHRIELLKSHMKAGKKIDPEILKAMPAQGIPEYDSGDDDDDDADGDFGDEEFLSSDFDSDDEAGPARLFAQRANLHTVPEVSENEEEESGNRVTLWDSDEEDDELPARFVTAMRGTANVHSHNRTIVLDSSDDEEEAAATAATGNASSEEEENDSDDMSESATQVATITTPVSEEDDSDFDAPVVVKPIPLRPRDLIAPTLVPPPLPSPHANHRLLFGYSSDDTSDDEVGGGVRKSAVLKPVLLETSSDESIMETSDDEVAPSKPLKFEASSDESDSDDEIGSAANVPSKTSKPSKPLKRQASSDDSDSDVEVMGIAKINPKIVLVSSSDEMFDSSEEEEAMYTSADEEWQ